MWTWVESKIDEDGNPNMGYETSYINLEGKEVKALLNMVFLNTL